MAYDGRSWYGVLRRTLSAFAFLAVLLGVARAGAGPGRNVTPEEAQSLIRKNAGNRNFVVLDVRTPGEFAQGHIEGAVLIDFQSPRFRTEMEGQDRGKTYLVYCRTGNRSARALTVMQELGFRDYYHLSEGIVRWVEAGKPTVR